MDTDFADGGIWRKNIMQNYMIHENFSTVLEDSDGNLIFSGPGPTISLQGFIRPFLSKFSSNGKPDTRFGENGFYWLGFVDIYTLTPVFQVGDQYIVAGFHHNETYKIECVSIDGSIGEHVYTSKIHYLQDMKLQGENKIVLGGGYRIDDSYSANFALERIIFDVETSNKPDVFNSNTPIVFPNPAKDVLYFNGETAFEIIDMQGRIVLKSENPVKSLEISCLDAGFYLVRFGGNRVQKIQILH